MVLFSDGLIERSSHFGEEQLDEALAAGPPGDADAVARTLRKVVLDQRADRADDLAALVITRTSSSPSGSDQAGRTATFTQRTIPITDTGTA